MDENKLSKQLKALYNVALANVAIWAIAIVALVILLEKGGIAKGMFVILAGGVAVAIQIIASIAQLRKG